MATALQRSSLIIAVLVGALIWAMPAAAQDKFCYEQDFTQGMGFFTHAGAYSGQTQTAAGVVPAPGSAGRIGLVWSGPDALSIDVMVVQLAEQVPSDGNANNAAWSSYAGQQLQFSGVASAGINYAPDPSIIPGAVLTFQRAAGNTNSPAMPNLMRIRITGKGPTAANNCGVYVQAQAGIVFPAIPSPTPIPTWRPQPTPAPDELLLSQTYNGIATAAAQVNSLPEDITAPQGNPLLTYDDGRQLFAYTKWIFSTHTAYELAGQQFGRFIITIFGWILMVIAILVLYLTIKISVWIIEFTARSWLWGQFRGLLSARLFRR